jgi:hypothetical protein
MKQTALLCLIVRLTLSAPVPGQAQGGQAQAGACDRGCLEGFVNQYLDALVARDPARLPLTRDAKYTENGVQLKLGDGMWGPKVVMGSYKLYFADPKSGQVGFYGSIEEHGHPAILGLRLKIEDRKISEMEAIALRSTARGTFSAVGDLNLAPIMTQALAPSEKRSRDELITVANSYFEGMEKGTDKETPFDKDCKRIENGVVTANDPGNAKEISRLSCGAQFATGFTKVITKVQERRFPVVDEERGLVWAFVRFDHAGKDKTITYNDGSVHPVNTPFDEPFSFQICELFKIRDGKILQIEALVTPVPYGMPTGWGGKASIKK